MKYRFKPGEFELGQSIMLEKVEEGPPAGEVELIRAVDHPHVFQVDKDVKRWIVNLETFNKRGYDGGQVQEKSFPEVKAYQVGESINDFGPAEDPPEFYYPDEPEPEPNPWMWVKGLWVLGSGCPSSDTFKDLGFNCVLRIGRGSSVDHIGVSGVGGIFFQAPPVNSSEEHRKVKAYFNRDEPEIVGKTPDSVIEGIAGIHQDSNLPAGVVLTTDFHSITKNHWNERWKEVIAVCDWVGIGGCYYYRGGKLNREWQDRLENAIRLIQAEGKPVIAIGQAHESKSFGATRPDMQEMDDFLRGLNCGVIWYAWNCGEDSIGQSSWYDDEMRKVNKGS